MANAWPSSRVSIIGPRSRSPRYFRALPRNDFSTQATCATMIRPVSADISGPIASSNRGASARSLIRSPWIRTDSSDRSRVGRINPYIDLPAMIRPASIGTTAKETISSLRGSRPLNSRSTTQKFASRQGVLPFARDAREYCHATLSARTLGADDRFTTTPTMRDRWRCASAPKQLRGRHPSDSSEEADSSPPN